MYYIGPFPGGASQETPTSVELSIKEPRKRRRSFTGCLKMISKSWAVNWNVVEQLNIENIPFVGLTKTLL